MGSLCRRGMRALGSPDLGRIEAGHELRSWLVFWTSPAIDSGWLAQSVALALATCVGTRLAFALTCSAYPQKSGSR